MAEDGVVPEPILLEDREEIEEANASWRRGRQQDQGRPRPTPTTTPTTVAMAWTLPGVRSRCPCRRGQGAVPQGHQEEGQGWQGRRDTDADHNFPERILAYEMAATIGGKFLEGADANDRQLIVPAGTATSCTEYGAQGPLAVEDGAPLVTNEHTRRLYFGTLPSCSPIACCRPSSSPTPTCRKRTTKSTRSLPPVQSVGRLACLQGRSAQGREPTQEHGLHLQWVCSPLNLRDWLVKVPAPHAPPPNKRRVAQGGSAHAALRPPAGVGGEDRMDVSDEHRVRHFRQTRIRMRNAASRLIRTVPPNPEQALRGHNRCRRCVQLAQAASVNSHEAQVFKLDADQMTKFDDKVIDELKTRAADAVMRGHLSSGPACACDAYALGALLREFGRTVRFPAELHRTHRLHPHPPTLVHAEQALRSGLRSSTRHQIYDSHQGLLPT